MNKDWDIFNKKKIETRSLEKTEFFYSELKKEPSYRQSWSKVEVKQVLSSIYSAVISARYYPFL